ncbi:TetR/AcrR family transcriptional regulator [Antrihabitans spumae]|jgi:AcrR family transcriptional regulator|uniref:TetR/AcrR family transcriptional regulator n=1 Tax=Antrihabitans spumae TaxID=3373370 RepID=A0ABW7K2V5_9NOCA
MQRNGVWGGRTTEERRADRLDRMLSVAIEIWSQHGWAAVTMRRVCAEAALSDRYFYKEFGDRDGLLTAVWQHIEGEVLATVAVAYAEKSGPGTSWEDLTRTATRVLVDHIVSHPAQAKILLSRNEGSPILESERQRSFHRAIDLVTSAARPRLRQGVDELALRMDAIVGVGGFVELLREWQSDAIAVDCDRIVDYVAEMATRFGGHYRLQH